MSKERNPDHRPLSRDEIKKLAVAAGCSDPKQPFNFGRHATLVYRLIGEVLRGRRDKAVAGTKELSATIAGRRVGTEDALAKLQEARADYLAALAARKDGVVAGIVFHDRAMNILATQADGGT